MQTTKLLFVSSKISQDNTGGAVVSRQNYRNFLELFGEENVEIFNLESFNNGAKTLRNIKNKVWNLINLRMEGHTVKNQKMMIKLIEEKKFSHIFFDTSLNGKLIKHLKKKFNDKVKIISFFHNVETSLLFKGLTRLNIISLIRLIPAFINEKLSASYSNVIIVLTKRDRELLKTILNAKNATVIPISIEDKLSNKIVSHPMSSPRRLLFIGSNYKPNIDGINWFVRKILPNINAELTIIGKGLSEKSLKLNDNVRLIKDVDDLNPYYDWADILLAPIFYGGGMKVKVAEALMHGKVVLGTKEAFMGYIHSPGILIEANTKKEFLENLRMIEGESYSEKARNVFINNYSSTAAQDKLRQIL